MAHIDTPKSGQPVRNNGALVVYGNTTRSDGGVTTTPSTTVVAKTRQRAANFPALSSADIHTAIAGTFANQEKGKYVITGVTNKLAGNNVSLFSAGSDVHTRRTIHKTESVITRHVVQYWANGFASGVSTTTDSFGGDDEANVRQDNQGEFLILTTGKVPDRAASVAAGNHLYKQYSKKNT